MSKSKTNQRFNIGSDEQNELKECFNYQPPSIAHPITYAERLAAQNRLDAVIADTARNFGNVATKEND